MIHRVKGFSVVSEAEVDVFLEFSCFLYDPMNIGNLISGSPAFSKSSLYIWKFLVHLEPYEQYKKAWLYILSLYPFLGFPGGPVVKTSSAMQETQTWSLGWEEPLEEEMAAHSSILAWRIPWTEEPHELESMGSQRVRCNWVCVCVCVCVWKCACAGTHTHTQGWGRGHSSWGSSLLCSPFAWQRNKVSLSFFSITLSPYFCSALVHREPAKGRLTRYMW